MTRNIGSYNMLFFRGCLRVALLAVGFVLADTLINPRAGTADDTIRLQIDYATYLGGSHWDQAREIIPLPDGSVMIGGQSSSADMRTTTGVVQPSYAGDDPNLGHGGVYGGDCYLARLNARGSQVVAASYLGGSRQERNVYGMELDAAGDIVITSMTRSRDIPVTPACFQSRHGGGPGTVFVAKVSLDLRRLIWCTYLGGSADESPRGGLALDASGNVCVFGTTASADFPTTTGAHSRQRRGPRDAFVAKLKSDGSDLVWSTFVGGSLDDFMLGGRLDNEGNVLFTGHTTSPDLPASTGTAQPTPGGQHDAYLARLTRDGTRLEFITYLGGSGNEFPEHRPLICADRSVLVPGVTASADFPTTPGALNSKLNGSNDAFLTRVAPDGKRFEFSTLLGGAATEFCLMPQIDQTGNIWIVGQTESRDLPTTPGAWQPEFGGGRSDGWLAAISSDGTRLRYCTYVGGRGDDMVRSIAIDRDGAVYLVGNTSSGDFPVSAGACQTTFGGGDGDMFAVKLLPSKDGEPHANPGHARTGRTIEKPRKQP